MSIFADLNFHRTPVTLIVAAVTIALELVCTLDLGDERRFFYYNTAQLGIWLQVWEGEIWRPFTTTLLHGNLVHLLMNLTALLAFGPPLELRLGPWPMLGLVVALAYTSSLAQYMIGGYNVPVESQSGLVGLSGVLFGLAGVLFVARRYDTQLGLLFTAQTARSVGIWFLVCVLLTQAGVLRIGNIAHGAGLLYGMLYGKLLFDVKNRSWWALATAAATLPMLATMIALPGHEAYEHLKAARGW